MKNFMLLLLLAFIFKVLAWSIFSESNTKLPEDSRRLSQPVVASLPKASSEEAPPAKQAVIETKPDPFSASELLKTHPRLQRLCDKAGGCQNVVISCERYDGKGNSNLRNTTVWKINALGTEGESFQPNNQPLGGYIEAAVSDWYETLEIEKEIAADGTLEPKTVYPNSSPCDESCLDRPKAKKPAIGVKPTLTPSAKADTLPVYTTSISGGGTYTLTPQGREYIQTYSIPPSCSRTRDSEGSYACSCPPGLVFGDGAGPKEGQYLRCWSRPPQ